MTRAKDVLPNINHTQAAEITPAATEWSRLLLNDVVCSERVTMCHAAEWTDRCRGAEGGCDGSAQHIFVPGDLDLSPWYSNSSQRGTKHVFHVNLTQICSAVPERFDSQTKKS